MGTRAFMHFFRPLFLVVMSSVYLACASGPGPEEVPEDIHQGIRHFNKATTYYIKGCYSKALQHVQEAHERFAVADQLQGSADSLNTMANIYFRLGDFQSALAVYDETIALFEQLEQTTGKVRALTNKSATLIAVRRLDDASQVLHQADDVAKNSNTFDGLRLKTRAMLLIAKNDVEGAEDLLVKALRATPESDQTLLADIYYALGHLMSTTRRSPQAVAHLKKALKIDHTTGAYFSVGLDLAALGDCYENMAKHVEAANFYKRSLKIFALLEALQKVQWVLPRLEDSAGKAGLNLQVTLHWTEQWLAGQRESSLCR
jgi:tetratricopeptide (TPR) repeat protein